MTANHETDFLWHSDVLSLEAQETLRSLSAQTFMKSFYLAGGTAVALQFGHRTSYDLDFFTGDVLNEEALLSSLSAVPGVKVIAQGSETLHLQVAATKVSLLGYHYSLLFPLRLFEGAPIADSRDIAAMKLRALASRGSKRDFVDLYVLSIRYGLKELLDLFERKFGPAEYNLIHLLKSLTYFTDADKEPMPHMLQPLSWERIKEFFISEAPRLQRPQ